MHELIDQLPPKARRGSKPRCHLLTHGKPEQVSQRLTSLAAPFAAVDANDSWMPVGFENIEEAELDKADRLLNEILRQQLQTWWLPSSPYRRRTPNFDIASTCTIDGKRGLLLVEAKAHETELQGESRGRPLAENSTEGRKLSHTTIGSAIAEAREGLQSATRLSCHISRDLRYQMSNRFAWAWKLTQLGIPVVLVYLGFTQADEMADIGEPFAEHASWERLVKGHSEPLFPAEVWGRSWVVNGETFVPLIRSLQVSLGGEELAGD